MKIKILGFSKTELYSVAAILGILGIAMILNLQLSLRRSRDSQRKSDIRSIYKALEAYQSSVGQLPASENGMIVACDSGEKNDMGLPILEGCAWGWSSLKSISDDAQVFLERIPSDPDHDDGARYLYISNSKRFQLFASLEGEDEAEYDPQIVARNLACGNEVCNFGLGYSDIPTNISLEEYEASIKDDKIN